MITTQPETRIPIRCDCCGTQIMGYMVGSTVVWYNRHHGQRHTVKVSLPSVAQALDTLNNNKS